MKRAIFILFALSLSLTPVFVNAQIPGLSKSDISISMTPENPGPNQTVLVSVTSFITNINAAKITWVLNGKVAKSGTGVKTFSFTSGNIGVTTTLGITVVTSEGQTIQNTIRIKPSTVDLVWQSESYTPPFYKGKALFSLQNKITFIAIPHITNGSGVEISPKNLVYKWSKNGSVDDANSGFGKNAFTVIPTVIARPLDITVEVTSQDSSLSGTATLHADPGDPMVLFYKKDPLYGIEFQKTLSDTVDIGDEKEIAVVAEPYFFGTVSPSDSLTYKWKINGVAIDSDTSQMARVFRPTTGTIGTSNISIQIENLNKILQLANQNFILKFGVKDDSTAL